MDVRGKMKKDKFENFDTSSIISPWEMEDLVKAKKIRELEIKQQRKKTCLVAVTAAALPSEKEEYLKEQVLDGYLIKPLKMIELQKVLDEVAYNHSSSSSESS